MYFIYYCVYKLIMVCFLIFRFKCIDSLVDTKSNDNGFISDHNPIICNIEYKKFL